MISQEDQSKLSPDAVLASLKEGNARYVEGKPVSRDLKTQSVVSLSSTSLIRGLETSLLVV